MPSERARRQAEADRATERDARLKAEAELAELKQREQQRLAEQTGHTYYLPSEAQWEYAARAKTTTKWSHGDDESQLKNYAWYDVNSGGKTHPVGEKLPNNWKLKDMAGNVWEWVEDCHSSNYNGVLTDGSAYGHPTDRSCSGVLRGGGWNNNDTSNLSPAKRNNNTPDNRNHNNGLRLARTARALSARV